MEKALKWVPYAAVKESKGEVAIYTRDENDESKKIEFDIGDNNIFHIRSYDMSNKIVNQDMMLKLYDCAYAYDAKAIIYHSKYIDGDIYEAELELMKKFDADSYRIGDMTIYTIIVDGLAGLPDYYYPNTRITIEDDKTPASILPTDEDHPNPELDDIEKDDPNDAVRKRDKDHALLKSYEYLNCDDFDLCLNRFYRYDCIITPVIGRLPSGKSFIELRCNGRCISSTQRITWRALSKAPKHVVAEVVGWANTGELREVLIRFFFKLCGTCYNRATILIYNSVNDSLHNFLVNNMGCEFDYEGDEDTRVLKYTKQFVNEKGELL